jgi:hypothetical protein
MSKIGPDADWSLCWEIWDGITTAPIKNLSMREIKTYNFETLSKYDHYVLGERGSHVKFGGRLLGDMVWVNKHGEESYVEIDGETKWKG